MDRERLGPFLPSILLATALATGCGDGAVEPPPPPPPVPTTITVSPASAMLQSLGETAQFTAEVRDQNGQTMANAAVTWTSSAPSVATVVASGLVTAVANGTATVTATAGSASGTATVTVDQVVATVEVEPVADTLLAFGDTLRLLAAALDANGNAVAGAEFAWASGDTLVAAVDQQGLVTGGAAGEVEVTATSADVTGRTQLAVLVPTPATVAIQPDTVGLNALGQTVRLAAEVRDRAGRAMEGVAVSWSSGDTLIATVDSAGLVTAAGNGTTTVAATADSASGQAAVTVMQSAGSVVLSPATDTIALGDTLRLAASAFDGNGHVIDATEFEWSSSDVSVARVDASGLVTALSEGHTTVAAIAGDVQGTADIRVENPDRAALVALYNATDGPNWVDNTNWLTDAPLDEWYGVDTDSFGRAVGLELPGEWDSNRREWLSHGLSGPIPPELGQLGELRTLSLAANDLYGSIPPELGQLATLTTLLLGSNNLSGQIPSEFANLASLERLDLGHNNLSGAIPPELGDLTNLRHLSFTWNGRFSGGGLTGPIPPELGQLIRLHHLGLGGNDLSGTIPPELAQLLDLRELGLHENLLSGPIPPGFGEFADLEWLYLHGNNLSGLVPREFTKLRELKRFWFSDNQGLCAPGNSEFVGWLRGVEARYSDRPVRGPYCNAADMMALESLYNATGGPGWQSSGGWLDGPAPEHWYGIVADSLGRVTALDLASNALVGELPRDLGLLAALTQLRIGDNALTGRLPLSLTDLPLVALHYASTDLCAPSEPSFQEWLSDIPSHQGTDQCEPLSDRAILELLYNDAGGSNWLRRDNWLSDAPLARWHGVAADGNGRVTALELRSNNLSGIIPPELGGLASLEILDLGEHDLSGPIPAEIGHLTKLRNLTMSAEYFPSNGGLSGHIPPELGNLASLEYLDLWNNNLSGNIPPELGNLTGLLLLNIGWNTLSDRIPPAVSGLANLQWLRLDRNSLSGTIPPELGGLTNLQSLRISENDLSGTIPPGLGGLPNLRWLYLNDNGLSGPIPPQIGRLANLRELYLNGNVLTGTVPAELGDLTRLGRLQLDNNVLSESLPPDIGRLANLRELGLSNNLEMSGTLPSNLTNLRELETLQAGGTDLCAPNDPPFAAWLEGVPTRRIASCATGGASRAYLTQAVQSPEFPVPLVAREDALLRVFVTAEHATDARMPPVRARFYLNGTETHVAETPGTSVRIPTEIDEGSPSGSANVVIPGRVVQPGLEVVIEVDPDGTRDPALGVAKRIPATGRLVFDVRPMPRFDLTVIPFLWTPDPDSMVMGLAAGMAWDPEGHELLRVTRTLLPVETLDVTAHAPVASSSNNAFALLRETDAIRVLEGGTGHYMGTMSGDVVGANGVARTPGRVSFSKPFAGVMAHELGHNMNLSHAPCGGAGGPDPSYPYPNGSIGAWGYDFREGRIVASHTADLMSYCGPSWISDYHFTNALRFRLSDEGAGAVGVATPRASTQSLLLWGGIDDEEHPFLEPAFVVEAPSLLPDSAGAYEMAGRTASGAELFSLSFAMPEVSDGDGSSSFAFALPVRASWVADLSSITLTGPGGSATLDGDTNRPMVLLRDPTSGQVRGFLRDLPYPAQAARDATGQVAEPGLQVLFSRGIPDAAAWKR